MSEQEKQEGIGWMRSRPESVKALMRKFPPSCYVRATHPLVCPRPGEIGRIASYYESGLVSVVADGNPIRGQCDPEWLEVVGYWEHITPEFVREAIGI